MGRRARLPRLACRRHRLRARRRPSRARPVVATTPDLSLGPKDESCAHLSSGPKDERKTSFSAPSHSPHIRRNNGIPTHLVPAMHSPCPDDPPTPPTLKQSPKVGLRRSGRGGAVDALASSSLAGTERGRCRQSPPLARTERGRRSHPQRTHRRRVAVALAAPRRRRRQRGLLRRRRSSAERSPRTPRRLVTTFAVAAQ